MLFGELRVNEDLVLQISNQYGEYAYICKVVKA